ncbi:Tetratricopeptide [Nostoc flagelliforme CCNUN1]|uniref:Tetratricopeptide n=1 Tax=Nostoc flagelliforme CCNUN1 TaxID=2038116 RepID=A0A2K8T1A9_9NOSO|nr:hypothetical protein [Nostoc flagelliforme]AUB40785.1 Tetratricopeptide [Nostoc flagelliforme CCNUN1]
MLQPVVEFYINHKDFINNINNLLSGAFPAIVYYLGWFIWTHRQRRIRYWLVVNLPQNWATVMMN